MKIKKCVAILVCLAAAFVAFAGPARAYTRYYGRMAGTGDWSGAGRMAGLKTAMNSWDNWGLGGGLGMLEPCTKEWIMHPDTGAIAWLDGQADDDDLVYFHFGGHGGYAEADADGDDDATPVWGDEIYGNHSAWYIYDDEFADAFQTINGGRKVFLMETCCAGGIVGGTHDLQPGQDNLTVGWSSAEEQDSLYEFVETLRRGCAKPEGGGFAPADFDQNHVITVGEWLEYARIFPEHSDNEVGWDGGGEEFPILYDNIAELACEISGNEGNYLYEYTLTNDSWQDHVEVFGIDLRDATVTDIAAPEGWTWQMEGNAVVWRAENPEACLDPGALLGDFLISSPCAPRAEQSAWGSEFTGFDDDGALFMGQDEGLTTIPMSAIPEPGSVMLVVCGLAGALGVISRRLRG
ncbi:MAG: hypothetical protein DRP79_00150 [Planctomycetota bacterium]|nr:MAG: hypothetical protein DRP79_00150 [Planctomycetota bacterium]